MAKNIDVYSGTVDMNRKLTTTAYKQKRIIINANNPRVRRSINLYETTNTTTSNKGDQPFSKWDGNTTHRGEIGNDDRDAMILHPPQNKFQVFFEQKPPELSINGVRAIVSSSSRERSPRVTEFFGGPRYYEANDNNNKSSINKPDSKLKSNLDMT